MSHYAYGIGWASASAGPLDLFKMTVAEGGIRSPMLIAGPGVKGGQQVDAFAYVWDIMPTILDLAGIPHPEKYQGRQIERMRGKSLKGVLTGSTKSVYGADKFVGGEMQNGKWMRGRVISKRCRLHRPTVPEHGISITLRMTRVRHMTLPKRGRKY
jgi:arylsulfatase